MSRLDDLLSQTTETTRTVSVRMPQSTEEELRAIAKKLSISRQRLVQEIFMHGLEEFRGKFKSNGNGHGEPAVVAEKQDDEPYDGGVEVVEDDNG